MPKYSEEIESGYFVKKDQTESLRTFYGRNKVRRIDRSACSGGCGAYLTKAERAVHQCSGPPKRPGIFKLPVFKQSPRPQPSKVTTDTKKQRLPQTPQKQTQKQLEKQWKKKFDKEWPKRWMSMQPKPPQKQKVKPAKKPVMPQLNRPILIAWDKMHPPRDRPKKRK